MAISQAMENYLKTIYELQQETKWVSTSALAKRLDHAPASVTNMVKKLSDPTLSLLDYVPYQGTRLTETGEKVALEVIRHHRLIELYLAEVMGVPWDEVHAEAERIEHVISEDIEERMAAALGYPTLDPHGSPIPAKDGQIIDRRVIPLADLDVGQTAVIAEVYDEDPALLRYVGELGLYPDEVVTLQAKEPFGGALSLWLEKHQTQQNISPTVAKQILVTQVQS